MTINWGAWAESGMAAAAGLDRMKRLGFGAIKPDRGVEALGYLILGQAQNNLQISSIIGSVFFWDRINRSERMFKELIPSQDKEGQAEIRRGMAAYQIFQSKHGASKLKAADAIAEQISLSVQHIVGSSVGLHDPLVAAGLDSLGAVELRNDLSKRLGYSLPGTLVFDYPSIDAISNYVIPQLIENAEEYSMEATKNTELSSFQTRQHRQVGIVGIKKRAPDVASTAALDAIDLVPIDRWDAEHHQDTSKIFVAGRFGGFVQNWGAYFDTEAFAVSSPEAMFMDPQQRVLLEDATEVSFISSNTAVAVGIAKLGEPTYYPLTTGKHRSSAGGGYAATGKALSAAAGRLSYTFGFSGPCVAIDTACSSSLVGLGYVHNAMTTYCSSGLACGINLPMNWETSSMFMAAGMMAIDGRCKTLDASANGYVRSEASVVVALQIQAASPLAIVAGVASNQDGRSSTLTAPNGPSQQSVIAHAAESSGILTSNISGIELHGTGTALGDPIEIGALCSVLLGSSSSIITLGTTKSRSGHAETAAGLLGLTNAVAQLQYSTQQPTMHLRTLNVYVENALAESKLSFVCARQEAPYTAEGAIGISAFAFQGTNAHAVLEQSDVSEVAEERQRRKNRSKVILVRKQRLWHIPAPHPFISGVLATAGASTQFEVEYSRAKSAYLWQHSVIGRSVLPGVALLDTLQAAATTFCNGQSVCLVDIIIPSALILAVGESSKIVCVLGQALIHVSSQDNVQLLTHCNATIQNQAVVQTSLEENEIPCSLVARVLWETASNFNNFTCASVGAVDACNKAMQIPASMDASLHLAGTFNDGTNNTPYVPSKLCAFSLNREAAALPRLWVSQEGVVDAKRMLASTRGSSSSWFVEELDSRPLEAMAARDKANDVLELLYETIYLVEMPVFPIIATRSTLCEFESRGQSSGKAKIAKCSDLDSLSAALSILQTRNVKQCGFTLPSFDLKSKSLTHALHAMLKVGDAELGEGTIGGCFNSKQRNQILHSAQNMPLVDRGYLKTPIMTKQSYCHRITRQLQSRSTRMAIITGGMGALGRLVTGWLQFQQQDDGQLKIILLGRNASQWKPNSNTRAKNPGEVQAMQCDVAQRDEFTFENLGIRLSAATIYHASGSVKDASISNQNPAFLRFALAPKIYSAWSLAREMINSAPIEKWVNFSSVAAMLGNGGQASYAAANGALDGFTIMIDNQGLSSTCFQWGPWAGSGMASIRESVASRLKRLGMVLINPATGLSALQRALEFIKQPVIGAVSVTDWNKLLRSSQKDLGIYSELLPEKPAAARQQVKKDIKHVNESIRLIVEESIGRSIKDDISTFMAVGLDSMGAVQLRNDIIQKFNIDLPATVTFDYPSVSKLAGFISSIEDNIDKIEETYPAANKQSQSSVDFVSSVQSIVGNVLGKYVSADEPLMQAGMDSMSAIELRSALASKFGVSLPATIIYDYPTSVSMAKYLEESFGSGGGGTHSSFAANAIVEHSSTAASSTGFISMTSVYPNGALNPIQATAQLNSYTDVTQVVPSSRWNIDAHYNPTAENGKMYVRFGGWLDNIDLFDSTLLRLSPRYVALLFSLKDPIIYLSSKLIKNIFLQ